MANIATVKPTSSKYLIRAHRVFNRKWFARIQATRKAIHLQLEKAKQDYDRQREIRVKEFTAEAVKLAGKPDLVGDGAICNNIPYSPRSGMCQLKQHEALALIRSPDAGNYDSEDVTTEDYLKLCEMGLDKEFEETSIDHIDVIERHLEELLHIQKQAKHGEKITSLKEENYVPAHLQIADYTKSDDPHGLNKRKKRMSPQRAREILEGGQRDVSGDAGKLSLEKI